MGLSDEEVVLSRKEHGSNEINKSKKNTLFSLIIESLGDPIIKILLLALLIKTVFLFRSFDWFETIGILVAVLLATLISSLSEYGSESAFNKMQASNTKSKVKVLRNNKLTEIELENIVKGDIVVLSSGDKVPADGYLKEGYVSIDESMLTGETKEIKKMPSLYEVDEKSSNYLFRGSCVYSGSAKMVITKVGSNTLYGSISEELQEKTGDSPLKIRLRGLAKAISIMGYWGAFLVVFSYLFTNIIIKNNFDITLILNTITNIPEVLEHLIYALTIGVTIIVLAVPEGLPMMITLVLSTNMRKMLKDNVLVRKMVGIETAGSLNILLTDKTGTITKGKLEVTKFVDYNNKSYSKYSDIKDNDLRRLLFKVLYYNNESSLVDNKIIGGNITDKALLEYVKSDYYFYKVISKEVFDSNKKYSEVTIFDKEYETYIKGAPEVIISKCHYIYDSNNNLVSLKSKNKIYEQIDNLTNSGSRVIMIAKKVNDVYAYIGLIAIKDEIRTEAYDAVKSIIKAGINIIMITGDNVKTAKKIASEVGIITSSDDIVLTSTEFNNLNDVDIISKLDKIKVIARAMPQDKSKLVKLAQSKNLVVGMTGDGVNDAPALKKADVGFAMGSGTEVAKAASDIVVLDDNIASISKAILYGRTIFKNIRKFIIYQLSINVCALLISIIGSFIGISEPITILQMLWINMIMDTFAALAFSFESPLQEYMDEKPKSKKEPIMNKYMLSEIIVAGLYCAMLCLLFLKLDFISNYFNNTSALYTAYFALFIFLGIFNAFNVRTYRINIFSKLYKNKIFILIFAFILITQIYIIYFGGNLFRTYGLNINELIIVIILSLTILPVDILRKILLKKKGYKFSL